MDTVIWRFTDGKAGHEAQTRGLVEALRERRPVTLFNVPVGRRGGGFLHWLSGRYPPGRPLPDPTLLLGAGHATHWPMLAARRARGGRAVVLMRPSLPLSWFDLCVVPEHDRPPAGARVLATRGVLNAIRPSARREAGRGLVVLGGPSRHCRWDNEQILAQLRRLLASRPLDQWWLSVSRRTPASLLPALQALGGYEYIPPSADSDRLEERLARATEVWVSEDSVSLVSEALSSGARVGLLQVQCSDSGRVAGFVKSLVDAGMVAEPGSLRLPEQAPQPLAEAARCARWIEERWLTDH
ncbi:MAG TPA: hypothetical protein ENK05_09095 [Gammaproteobacteria bacterium]|nr:hypothetical protein [Gammaproteobacteria bacterium]